MDEEDITEWEFAQKHIGSFADWTRICETNWFKPYIARWRKELELKLRARHLKQIAIAALSEGKDSLSANRYLVDRGYKIEAPGASRGRPSKHEISERAQQMAEFETDAQNDLERLQQMRTVN